MPSNQPSFSCTAFRDVVGCLLLGIFALGSSSAQTPQPVPFRVAHLSVDEGLSQSTVTSIAQDAQGFLWFATSDGLNKYDGNEFVTYKHDSEDPLSPPSDDLTSLVCPDQYSVWVGSASGLVRYDKRINGFKRYQIRSRTSTIEPGAQVNCIVNGQDNEVWVGTTHGFGVVTGDSGTMISERAKQLLGATASMHSIEAMYKTRGGTVWISGDTELVCIPSSGERVAKFAVPLPKSTVRSILEDSDGTLWFGTDDSRLYRFVSQAHRDSNNDGLVSVILPGAKPQAGNLLSSLAEDHTGRIWIGTRLSGLYTLDRPRMQPEPYVVPLPGERLEGVRSIAIDRSGLVWVGYDGAGIVKINPEPKQIHHFLLATAKGSMEDGENFLKPILQDHRGRWWLGTFDRGLTVIDRKSGKRERFVHESGNPFSLPVNHLLTLGEDRAGRIWVGTTNGIARWDEIRRRFQVYNSLLSPHDSISDCGVWAFSFDSLGGVWAGVGNGLLRFDSQADQFRLVLRTDSIRANWIESLAASKDSTLWVGTAKAGLFHINRDYVVMEHFGTFSPGTLCDNFVKSILLEPNGELWAGTTGGLSHRDPVSKKWESFHRKDGLPDEMIYGILPAGGHQYWFSTNRGIVRLNAADRTHPRFKTYTPEDGLQSYEFNTNCYYKSPTGELMFGGIHGLNYFFPDSVKDNPNPPTMVLTQLKKFDQRVNPGLAIEIDSAVTLGYTETVFSFEFSALEYTNPERNTYSYLLEGYDRHWIDCGTRREARYTNLNAGRYVFRVRGRNNDGTLSVHDAAVVVTIIPPFWKTGWFLALALIAVAGSFGGTVRYVSIRKIQAQLRELEQERLMEKQRKETRESIARDLHDDVSSTLSSMALFVETSRQRLQAGAEDSVSAFVRLQTMARDAEDAIEQAVWSLSSQHQRLSHLVARIHDMTVERCSEHGIQSSVAISEITDDFNLSDVVRKNCFLIFRECFANALKHGRPRIVNVGIAITKEDFSMTISDDGRGFDGVNPTAKSRGGNGVRNMQVRAGEMGGLMTIHSTPGIGTTVTLSMRLTQMRY